MAATKPMTISLPADLLRETQRVASVEATTPAKLVEVALRQYLTSHRWRRLRQWGTETAKRLNLKSDADLDRFLRGGRSRSLSRPVITAVADTNIYISAMLFGGPCETILGMARGGLIAVYHSPAIERELQRTLHDKFRWTDPQVRDALLELRAVSHRILPTVRLTGVMQDDTDHRIIECAVAAQVEYLITGDKRHLQPLKHFRGIAIVSPAFLNLFT